jgi:hypothetical protein
VDISKFFKLVSTNVDQTIFEDWHLPVGTIMIGRCEMHGARDTFCLLLQRTNNMRTILGFPKDFAFVQFYI